MLAISTGGVQLEKTKRVHGAAQQQKGPTAQPDVSWQFNMPATPILARDIQSLRYTLGNSYRENLYLLGYPQKVLLGDKESDDEAANQVVGPYLSILVRLLWEYPEDSPMPEMPTVQDMRKRFAPIAPKRGRDGLASANWIAVLAGARYNNGSDWQSQGKSPSPTTRRLFWLISTMADKYGEVEALRRWEAAAETEALARGTTLRTILDNKSGWPKMEGEKVSGGGAQRKVGSQADDDESLDTDD
jgi:hypothetical protein